MKKTILLALVMLTSLQLTFASLADKQDIDRCQQIIAVQLYKLINEEKEADIKTGLREASKKSVVDTTPVALEIIVDFLRRKSFFDDADKELLDGECTDLQLLQQRIEKDEDAALFFKKWIKQVKTFLAAYRKKRELQLSSFSLVRSAAEKLDRENDNLLDDLMNTMFTQYSENSDLPSVAVLISFLEEKEYLSSDDVSNIKTAYSNWADLEAVIEGISPLLPLHDQILTLRDIKEILIENESNTSDYSEVDSVSIEIDANVEETLRQKIKRTYRKFKASSRYKNSRNFADKATKDTKNFAKKATKDTKKFVKNTKEKVKKKWRKFKKKW